jgi:hypothetical protein
MAEPVLDLNTLVERRTIRIDGAPYELTNHSEVSILDYYRIGRQSERLDAMVNQPEAMAPEQVEELQRLLNELVRFVLRAPDDVHARLNDIQKLQIISVFTDLQRGAAAPAGATVEPPRTKAATLTGASSSPGSSGSTVARRSLGSRKSRSR